MRKQYLVFVEDIDRELREGEELVLTVKDLTPGARKYDNRVVRALVARDPEKLPGADRLHVRSWTGVLYPGTWAIRVLAELGELQPGVPHGESLKVM